MRPAKFYTRPAKLYTRPEKKTLFLRFNVSWYDFRTAKKGVKMSEISARKGPNLRKLEFSPDLNPLVVTTDIELKRRRVRTGLKQDLVDPSTGVISGAATIHTIEEKDDEEFVKVFAAGVKAVYDLSRTAARVFQAVLEIYQSEPMNGGFADSVYLAWFDGGLSGKDVGMSDDTFSRGLKELLSKGFLSPRQPNLFWVNPSLFFKGNRVLFLREYRRKSTSETKKNQLENSNQGKFDV